MSIKRAELANWHAEQLRAINARVITYARSMSKELVAMYEAKIAKERELHAEAVRFLSASPELVTQYEIWQEQPRQWKRVGWQEYATSTAAKQIAYVIAE